MFLERLRTVSDHVQTVRSIIATSKKLRGILFQSIKNENSKAQRNSELLDLKNIAPSLNDWQVYDHCSAVTRLYAIYENFVENIITDWIVLLPNLFPNYSDLAEEVRSTHQIGVAQLLQELKKKKSRFEHLSVEEVIRGLFLGVSNSDNQYDLVPEAFLLHDQNLRKEALEKLFADAGLPKAWNWIERHRDMKFFIEEVRANENTPEGELKQLIDYRNESAHGGIVSSFLDTNTLLALCDFVEALCRSLAELITYKIIERRKSIGQINQVGKITEWFKKPNAGVAIVKNTSLSVGNFIFLVNERISYCQLAIIQNIQLNEENQEKVAIVDETEVGLKFDIPAKKDLLIYIEER
jgi:RiboL-PSP-HEPN